MDAMREEMIAHCHHHEIHIPSWKLSQEARRLWPEKPAEHWYVDTYMYQADCSHRCWQRTGLHRRGHIGCAR